MGPLHVIKVGGAVINNPSALTDFLSALAGLPEPALLVHGGGRTVNEWLTRIGHQIVIKDGRRITDDVTLELAVMSYAGLVNKRIVSELQRLGVNCLGLTGADLASIRAVKRQHPTVDYGWVGDIVHVNADAYRNLIEAGVLPVCCAITDDHAGQLLNTNADTIASAIATALSRHYSVSLWYTFEHAGVLRDKGRPDSLLASLNQAQALAMIEAGAIDAGMRPKLDNCFDALRSGVQHVHICAASALAHLPHPTGTTLHL